jgi:hypothetical protein
MRAFLGAFVCAAALVFNLLAPAAAYAVSYSDAVQFRLSFGLRSDRDWITYVAQQPNASDALYGVELLPSEVAELDRREMIFDRIPDLRQYEAKTGDSFAGMYLDQAGGGRLIVRYTGDYSTRAETIRALVPDDIDVEVEGADFSMQELAATKRALELDLQSLRLKGVLVTLVGTSPTLDRVIVDIDTASIAGADAIVQAYGPSVVVGSMDGVQSVTCVSRSSCTPIRGGLKIFSSTANCTSGFVAADTSGYTYLITAGHCGGIDQ